MNVLTPGSSLQKPACISAGWTISEVLLVSTLIATLLAFLLPLAGRFVQESRRVKCADQLRQIGVMMQLYLGEHQNQFPPAWTEFRNSAGKTERKFWGGFLVEYNQLKDLRCFVCPSVKNEDVIPGLLKNQTGSNMAYISYGINRYGIAPGFNDGKRPAHLTAIPEPSRVLMAVDHELKGQPHDGWYIVDYSTADKVFEEVSMRHSGTVNALYCDGHVEIATSKEKLLGKTNSDYPWAENRYLKKK